MLKRLLFAVFVLGLVFSLSGTAISGIGQKPAEALNAIPTINPNAQLYNDIEDARPTPAEFKKPIEEGPIEVQMSGVSATPPSAYFCEDIGYYDDTVTAVWVWSIPDAWGDDLMNMRFTVDAGIECTLKVGWILMYGGYATGTPDMRLYLWDDDGFGFPGNKLDSADVPNAAMGGSFWWASADWAAADWVFTNGEEYHIGWSTLGGDGDTLWCASDKGTGPHSYTGEERASENWAGYWGTMLADWGDDVCFLMTSERCCFELPYSDCYSQSWDEGTAYYWRSPHPDYDIFDYAQRFTVAGIETLQSVDMSVYDMGTTPPNVSGNGNLIIKVWDDDGFGYPGSVLATQIVPAGTYPFHPAQMNVDFYSDNLVFTSEDFYVSFNSDETWPNDCEGTLSDDESTPHGRSYAYYGGWVTIGTLFGVDVDLKYTANLCKDPFVDCKTLWYYTAPVYYWTLPDAYGDFASAQLIKSIGQDCQVKEVSWALYQWGSPVAYTYDSKVSVMADAGGLPGAELASKIVTPAEYVFFPGMTTVDFTADAVSVGEYYWIAVESYAPTEDEGIATMTDFGGGGWWNGAAMNWAGYWGLLCVDWAGVPCDIAYIAEAYHCCIPFDERDCSANEKAGEDWATHQHDQQRTGASFNSFSDAQCDLTVIWEYVHPTNSIWYTGPAISGGRIACPWDNQVQVLDLATGANIYTIVGFPLGNNIRCTPTIINGVMYLSGGDQQSVSAWDFATGAMIWSRDIVTVGVAGLFGQTRHSNFIVLDQGGTDVLYFGTDDGAIVAVEAATGALYGGWVPNPVFIPTGSPLKSGSTYGTDLFYNTYPGGVEGDVYSIDAASGAINWALSTAGGLQANAIFPEGPQLAEGFPGGNSVEDGILYVNSNIGGPYHPGDGVMYAIFTSDGSIKWAVPSIGGRGASASGTPVIDEARIYSTGQSYWATPPAGGRVLAFSKISGAQAWANSSPEAPNNGWGDMALSCEPEGAPDLLFMAGHHGFIGIINSANGDEVYRRRVDWGGYPNSVALAFAISPGYLAMTDFYGGLYVMAKGDDRPRMELQTYQPDISVEFGPLTSLHVPIPGAITNTGCADLTFGQLTTNLTPNHPFIPVFAPTTVRPDVMDRAASITDKLTDSWAAKAVPAGLDADLDEYFVMRDRGEQMLNLGANAGVPFLQYATYLEAVVSPLAGELLAAGDTVDIVLDVLQANVVRGPQDFYMTIPSDDPDFHLNPPPYGDPEIHVTVVGGCLTDTVSMPFGMGGANTQIVTNTGRLGLGDWEPHCLDIDGDDGSFYQGGLIYANDLHNVALNCHAWYGQGEAFSWHSMQPDPTWCDDVCAIALVEDVTLSCLGGYSDDGGTYTPIMGNFVCATYLDSMQDFSLGGSVEWQWSNFDAAFDNDLTIGLIVNSRTVAAVDFAPLANITVDIMEFTERNGDSVEGWRFGAFVDYDIGNDRAQIDREGSVAFQSSGGVGDTQWGMMKFPFGCGSNPNVDFEPMINAVSGHGDGMFYDQYSPPYLDSAWLWMGRPAGLYSQNITSDEEFHCTFATHDFVGGDTYEIAVAQFALHGTDGTSAEAVALAKLANKWLGFSRGDVDNVGSPPNLADIIYLANFVNGKGPGPIPFMHLGDVDCDGDVDMDDVLYLIAWYFGDGPCPCGDWCF